MRNLAVFLVRHYFFLFFLLLEILAVYFLVKRNFYQHTSAVSVANWFTGSLYQARTDFTEYLDLKEQNKTLADKLAEQFNQQNTSYFLYTSKGVAYNDTVFRERYEYLAADVIDNTVTRRNNYIVLNRGTNQGVLVDMGVVCADGVVGIVREVSDNFCVVMSLLHSDSKISTSLKKDGSFGTLVWDGADYRTATLKDLPVVPVKKGDTLVSSGLGEAFPSGVAVGTIETFKINSENKTYIVDVKLATDYKKLRHVFIVKNLLRGEINDLKTKAGIEND
ncbi:MAG: rod shape-determining protein MreC [Bacteroidota bacterium]|nr:rod shape-determining protein MreC [Bacteroidota bacterium]